MGKSGVLSSYSRSRWEYRVAVFCFCRCCCCFFEFMIDGWLRRFAVNGRYYWYHYLCPYDRRLFCTVIKAKIHDRKNATKRGKPAVTRQLLVLYFALLACTQAAVAGTPPKTDREKEGRRVGCRDDKRQNNNRPPLSIDTSTKKKKVSPSQTH